MFKQKMSLIYIGGGGMWKPVVPEKVLIHLASDNVSPSPQSINDAEMFPNCSFDRNKTKALVFIYVTHGECLPVGASTDMCFTTGL